MKKLLLLATIALAFATPAAAGDLDDPGYRNHPQHPRYFEPARAGQPNPANDRLAARVAQYLVYDEQCNYSVLPPLPNWLKQQIHKIEDAIPDDVAPAVDFMRKQFDRSRNSACQAIAYHVARETMHGPKFPELVLTDSQGHLIPTVPQSDGENK
jgi:hypothetical protein